MDRNTIMDYIMNSPENTNPNILGEMLDEVSGEKLPDIDPTEDEGKVLGVEDGNYKLVTPKDVESPVIKVYTEDAESNKFYPKTLEEFNKLFSDSNVCIILLVDDTQGYEQRLGITTYSNFGLNDQIEYHNGYLYVRKYSFIEDDDENYIGITISSQDIPLT